MSRITTLRPLWLVIGAASIGLNGYLYYIIEIQQTTIATLLDTRDELHTTLSAREVKLRTLTTEQTETATELARIRTILSETEQILRREQNRNAEFEEQIESIASTVGVLDKLAKTDKELLRKYSKVAFLNEHYIPTSLTEIDDRWKYSENRSHKLHSSVEPFLDRMLSDALADGVEIWVVSAYRSFNEQALLKNGYTVQYGSGANAFSADQGFSEHQLGTAVDFTTRGLQGGLTGFENTAAFTWLEKNAHRYGFTLSYPRGNAYYIFEPWHWRFVGRDLARDLYRDGAHFYDWEQRRIDEYLLNIFE